jgi:hypothetical protein
MQSNSKRTIFLVSLTLVIAVLITAVVVMNDGENAQSKASNEGSTEGHPATSEMPLEAVTRSKSDGLEDRPIQMDSMLDRDEVVTLHSSLATECGLVHVDSSEVEHDLLPEEDHSGLTEEQQQALRRIEDKCHSWKQEFLGYANSLEMAEILEEAKTASESLVSTMMSEGLSSETEAEMVNLIHDSPAELSLTALTFLLNDSHTFREAMSMSVGMSSGTYLDHGSPDIVSLYACRLEKDCSRTSVTALSNCVIDVRYCGLSVTEAVNRRYSPNYAADLHRMVDAIWQARRQRVPVIDPCCTE